MVFCALAYQNCSPIEMQSAAASKNEPLTLRSELNPDLNCEDPGNGLLRDRLCENRNAFKISLDSLRSRVDFPNTNENIFITLKLSKPLESDFEVEIKLGPTGCEVQFEGETSYSKECLKELLSTCRLRNCDDSELLFEPALPIEAKVGDTVRRVTFWDFDDREFRSSKVDGKVIIPAGETEFRFRISVTKDLVLSKDKIFMARAVGLFEGRLIESKLPIVLEKSSNPDLLPGEVSFTSVYQNIISPRCTGCHNPVTLSANLDFTNFESLFDARRIIDLENPEQSELLLRVSSARTGKPQMPLATAPLSADEVMAIRSWLISGARKN